MATPLKKEASPSQQLLAAHSIILQRIRVVSHEPYPILCGMLTSCTGKHSCYVFISETFMSCPEDNAPHHTPHPLALIFFSFSLPQCSLGLGRGALDVPSRAKHLTVALFSVPVMVSTLTVTSHKQRLLTPRLRSPLSLGKTINIWKRTFRSSVSPPHTVILMEKYSTNLKSCPFICEQNESHMD